MTPRSAHNYLAYLTTLQHPSKDEVLYTEAKLAMGEGDTTTARTLFDQCPTEYRHVKQYTKQLDTYDTLCTHGVIDRRDTLDVRVFIADIIGEETTCPSVVRYADSLIRHGYNRRSLDVLTMTSMGRCMDHASMTDGHRCLFEDTITKRTPLMEFLFMSTVRALERCGNVAKCIRSSVPEDMPKNMWMAKNRRDDDDDDDDDDNDDERGTRSISDEDETAGD